MPASTPADQTPTQTEGEALKPEDYPLTEPKYANRKIEDVVEDYRSEAKRINTAYANGDIDKSERNQQYADLRKDMQSHTDYDKLLMAERLGLSSYD